MGWRRLEPFGVETDGQGREVRLSDLVDKEFMGEVEERARLEGIAVVRDAPFVEDESPSSSRDFGLDRVGDRSVDNVRGNGPLVGFTSLLPHVDTFTAGHTVVWYKPKVEQGEAYTRFIPSDRGLQSMHAAISELIIRLGVDVDPYRENVRERHERIRRTDPIRRLYNNMGREDDKSSKQSQSNLDIMREAAPYTQAILEQDFSMGVKQRAIAHLDRIVTFNPDYRDAFLADVNEVLEDHKDSMHVHEWRAKDMVFMTGSPEIMHQKWREGWSGAQSPLYRTLVLNYQRPPGVTP